MHTSGRSYPKEMDVKSVHFWNLDYEPQGDPKENPVDSHWAARHGSLFAPEKATLASSSGAVGTCHRPRDLGHGTRLPVDFQRDGKKGELTLPFWRVKGTPLHESLSFVPALYLFVGTQSKGKPLFKRNNWALQVWLCPRPKIPHYPPTNGHGTSGRGWSWKTTFHLKGPPVRFHVNWRDGTYYRSTL